MTTAAASMQHIVAWAKHFAKRRVRHSNSFNRLQPARSPPSEAIQLRMWLISKARADSARAQSDAVLDSETPLIVSSLLGVYFQFTFNSHLLCNPDERTLRSLGSPGSLHVTLRSMQLLPDLPPLLRAGLGQVAICCNAAGTTRAATSSTFGRPASPLRFEPKSLSGGIHLSVFSNFPNIPKTKFRNPCRIPKLFQARSKPFHAMLPKLVGECPQVPALTGSLWSLTWSCAMRISAVP